MTRRIEGLWTKRQRLNLRIDSYTGAIVRKRKK